MAKQTASGVTLTPVSIKGKDYITVSQRIAEANASAMIPRFQIIETKFFEFGGLHLCQVVIDIEGKQFRGTASVNIGGRGVDATNPVENAETSALGRALGLAGFGSFESVASAEEVVSAISRGQAGSQGQVGPIKTVLATQPKPGQAALESQKETIKGYCEQLRMGGEALARAMQDLGGIKWATMSQIQAEAVLNHLEYLLDTRMPEEIAE